MADLPQNPYYRGSVDGDATDDDFFQVMDEIRRMLMLENGHPDNVGASISDRVEVPGNTTLTVTVEPGEQKMFLVQSMTVNPADVNTDYRLRTDNTETDANSNNFIPPETVRQQLSYRITNNTGNPQRYSVLSTAVEVPKGER